MWEIINKLTHGIIKSVDEMLLKSLERKLSIFQKNLPTNLNVM